jgi:hypothetical protein
LPLSERARVEVYLPDLPLAVYQNLDKLKAACFAALEEDAMLVAVMKTYHAV